MGLMQRLTTEQKTILAWRKRRDSIVGKLLFENKRMTLEDAQTEAHRQLGPMLGKRKKSTKHKRKISTYSKAPTIRKSICSICGNLAKKGRKYCRVCNKQIKEKKRLSEKAGTEFALKHEQERAFVARKLHEYRASYRNK